MSKWSERCIRLPSMHLNSRVRRFGLRKLLTVALGLALVNVTACSINKGTHSGLLRMDQKHVQKVRVKSTPSPATIYANGVRLGTTPLTVTLNHRPDYEISLTALPIYAHQFRQDIALAKGFLPKKVLFHMDLPSDADVNKDQENKHASDNDSVHSNDSHTICQKRGIPVFYFPTGQFQLSDMQNADLVCFVQQLDLKRLKLIRVFGHADERHNPRFNIKLSLQRSQTVANRLRAAGIPSEKLETYGLGEVETLDLNAEKIPLKFNRKVNLEVDFR